MNQLKPLVDKLTLSSNKLELILKNQRYSNNRAGIGDNSICTNRVSATKFHSSKFSAPKPFTSKLSTYKSFKKPNIVYYSCNGVGHKSFNVIWKRKVKVKWKNLGS